MPDISTASPETSSNTSGVEQEYSNLLSWLFVAGLVYLLICAVGLIGGGFKIATGGQAKQLFEFATNPFMGLVIGTVATALIQSSSTVTSIIVALVAGGLPVAIAVPMIMGANVGTSITNTIVSLGHVRDKTEFRRAFSAATVHDYFNLLSVVIFLPLEMAFGIFEHLGGMLARLLVSDSGVDMGGMNFVKWAVHPVVGGLKSAVSSLPTAAGGTLLIVAGIGMIFLSILFIGRLLKTLMVGRAKVMMHSAIGRGPIAGILSGTVVTILVQSSSTTTSLMVPLAGSGVFTTRQIYPFTLGANIGTCVTALVAATAISGPPAVFALQIALIHFLYNLLGVVLIYGVAVLREIPPKAADWLANLAAERKIYALVYILGVFFVAPGMCLMVTRLI